MTFVIFQRGEVKCHGQIEDLKNTFSVTGNSLKRRFFPSEVRFLGLIYESARVCKFHVYIDITR